MKAIVLLVVGGCTVQSSATEPSYYPRATSSPSSPAPALETEREYEDSQGTKVKLRLGERAFADQVTGYWPGTPKPPRLAQDPQAALGVPDRGAHQDETLGVTLGCRGSLAVAFQDIALYDGPGADLHIFEVGDDIEQMAIDVSSDGATWISVGDVRGQPASIDFAGSAATGSYRFVRITDLGKHCNSPWPGADVDAVGAINAR